MNMGRVKTITGEPVLTLLLLYDIYVSDVDAFAFISAFKSTVITDWGGDDAVAWNILSICPAILAEVTAKR